MGKYPKVNYIGNKEKLVNWIIDEMPVKSGTVLDIFAGGCSVSYALKNSGYSVIANDILFADYVIAKALVENSDATLPVTAFDIKVSGKRISELNDKFSFLAGCLYYPEEVWELSKLVAIAEKLKGSEKYIMLALIRRAMIRKLPYSRMNVPWEQIQKLRDEDYSYRKYKRKRAYHNLSFESHVRKDIDEYNNAIFAKEECKVYNCDAFDMVSKIDFVDVVYMDPPYPSTMNNYDAFYGMFDKMFDKKKEHTDYTQKTSFLDNMDKLVKKLVGKTRYIMLSQNTRVQPSPNEIEEMLKKYGKVIIKEKKHNYQVTGKENKNVSKELLFILEMEEKNMAKTKIRPPKEIYEDYWKMTAAWTDIFGTKFNNCLKLTIHFIDAHIEDIEELKNDVKNFRESSLYADLQDKIVKAMGWRGKDPKVNARKGINQFVKLGFIDPFLSNYNPLAKQFVLTSDKKKKKIIFSKLFYQNSDFSASITKEKCRSQQIEFLLKTLNYNKELSKEDIVALMVTDVNVYKRGYLTKNELKKQYRFCKEDNFEERKYNQIGHLMNLLKKFVQVTYNKETQKFYFADDPEAQKYRTKKEIDPIRLRIHKQELENESISLYGKKICYLLRKNYKGLVDSHIKPKDLCLKEGNEDEAYDVNNALWLAPHVDAYFNYFDISFDEEGKVLIGKNIPTEISVEFQNKNLDEKVMNEYRKRYLEYHRKRFMEKNGN